MNNEFVKEWLQWAIDFIQMDISKLSHKEKHSFYQKFNWFASYYLFNASFDPFGKRIQFSQNQIIEWEIIASEIQEVFKEFLNAIGTHASYGLPELTSFIRPEGLPPILSRGKDGKDRLITKDHHIYFQMNFHPKDLTPKNWAILNLAKLIQGLEWNVIRKCKGCQRYLLNFSLREKIYCSPRCASRSLARSREERWGPEKYGIYKRKQKKRTMRGYEKKRKEQGKIVRHRPKKRAKKVSVKVL